MRGGIGGGGGHGGMLKTIHRAVRTGVGGANQETLPHSTTTADEDDAITTSTSTTTTPKPTYKINTSNRLSLSSSLNLPISPTWTRSCSSPIYSDEFEWEYVDGIEDEGRASSYAFNDDFVFGSVPSKDEVQHAVSAIQQVFDPTSFSKLITGRVPYNSDKGVAEDIASPRMNRVSSVGRELDWIEPSFNLCNPRMLQCHGYDRVYDAFHLLHTEPSIQRMVMSLSSDKAVWDAVLDNEVVRELRESLIKADRSAPENQSDRSDSFNAATDILNWIFNNTKAKVMTLMENITKLVNSLFQPHKDETTGGATDPVVRTSLMLSIVVLLVVVVTRASMA